MSFWIGFFFYKFWIMREVQPRESLIKVFFGYILDAVILRVSFSSYSAKLAISCTRLYYYWVTFLKKFKPNGICVNLYLIS